LLSLSELRLLADASTTDRFYCLQCPDAQQEWPSSSNHGAAGSSHTRCERGTSVGGRSKRLPRMACGLGRNMGRRDAMEKRNLAKGRAHAAWRRGCMVLRRCETGPHHIAGFASAMIVGCCLKREGDAPPHDRAESGGSVVSMPSLRIMRSALLATSS
jgi:hypothetical protein